MNRLLAEKSPNFAIGNSPRHTHKWIYGVGYINSRADINMNTRNVPQILKMAIYMGISPFLICGICFDHVDFVRRPRTYFWERALKWGIPGKKNEEKILKSSGRIKSDFAPRTPYFWLITILLVTKPPNGIGLFLSNYKKDSHDLWLLCGSRELRERSKYATFAFFQNFKNRLSNKAKQTVHST